MVVNNILEKSKVTIQGKLVLIIVLVSTVSLLLAATLFTVFQLREYRLSMVESLSSTAKITAENVQAAIWFEDEGDANKLLAEFASDPRIITAAIYTKDKELFAVYDVTNEYDSVFFEFADPSQHYQFDTKSLHLYQPISLQDKTTIIGYVYLKASLDSIHQQLKKNILVTLLIVFSVLIITLLLTSKLQKIISGPILQLLQVTKRIKDKKDYSIRVARDDYLEIQQLCDGFNLMLEEIQDRDEHLQHLALYDELTGIPNRSLFVDHFHTAIARSQRTDTQLAICFLDIDNFKPINDGFGHKVGDKLLVEVANRITASIRKEDTVSRQGGDEFAILLGDIQSYGQFEQSMERIYHAITQPYSIDGFQHKVTVSSGVTLYPSDDGDIDTLIRHADQAMYNAKLAGKHRYHLFNPLHDQKIIQKHHKLDEIEQALVSNQFSLFYQPKVNMATGKVFGVEALIRWIDPEKGVIPPLDFLPVTEGTRLENEIGNWVINQALMQLDEWHSQDVKLEVSVNISSHHLQSNVFISTLADALEKYSNVDPKLLQLEVLESSALDDIHTIGSIISACQALGVSIALDDFGTGYSSLTHIRHLAVDVIKVDRSFVRDVLDDPSDYTIVNGVIGLADSFNRKVIAEGVETTEHGLVLLMSGCNEAQGYGIARPMPISDFTKWISNYRPNQHWLRCAAEKRTDQESKIKLFKLFTDQWITRFETYIQAPSGSGVVWPIMDRRSSHFGYWIKRAKQEYLFDDHWLQSLNKRYEKITEIADSLLFQYQKGDTETARKGIESLHIAVEEVNALLHQVSNGSSQNSMEA
jgi:diguanylate cyclase (GGDEF)-like protein